EPANDRIKICCLTNLTTPQRFLKERIRKLQNDGCTDKGFHAVDESLSIPHEAETPRGNRGDRYLQCESITATGFRLNLKKNSGINDSEKIMPTTITSCRKLIMNTWF